MFSQIAGRVQEGLRIRVVGSSDATRRVEREAHRAAGGNVASLLQPIKEVREMGATETVLMQTMSDYERLFFTSAMTSARKGRTTGLLLTLILGGIGAHRFYLGDTRLGFLYVLFCWTFVPAFVAFVELFLITGRIERYNANLATRTARSIQRLGRHSQATGE